MIESTTVQRATLVFFVVLVEVMRRYYFCKASGPGIGEAYMKRRSDVWLIGILSIAWFISIGAFVLVPKSIAWANMPLRPAAPQLGFVLASIAVCGLLWVHHALGANFSSVLRIKEDHQLVRSGPYRHVRHPMYVVFSVQVVAYCLISANLCIGLLGVLLVSALTSIRVPKEESDLAAKFGDEYRAYCKQTGRFIPKIH